MIFARLFAVLMIATCTTAFAQKTGTPAPDVVTIDQTKATNGGITSGDAAGFPITISQPGSYKLMSNLVVPAGVDGIQVTASNVSIDLNGFSITGPITCGGNFASLTCAAGATRGITAMGDLFRLAVRNGVVAGFATCLEGRRGARIDAVSLADCGTAMWVFEGSVVTQVSIHRSADAGSLYGSTADAMQLYWVRTGFVTSGSMLRSVSMNSVYQAFSAAGNGTNSALSLSMINATVLGTGVQSVGGNLCNGVSC